MTETPTLGELRDLAARFIAREVNPHVNEWEAKGEFPAGAVFKQLGSLGLLGINKPEAFGGLGLDYTYQATFAESLGTLESTGIALAIGVQTDMATPALARWGSDELREEFLRPTIAGDRIAAIGVSEISGGSDLTAIKTNARICGGDYIINGGKMWTTNGANADWICVLANTSRAADSLEERAMLNKSLICIPTDAAGVSRSTKLKKLGMHTSDTVQIFFDDVRVPLRYLIGRQGKGFAYQMRQFCDERLSISLATIASMRDTIKRTILYTSERRAFGIPIIHNQSVQHCLAELYAQVETVHAMAWRTVHEYVAGKPVALPTAILKLNVGRLVRKVNDKCLQLWGGMGFMDENLVARRYRDQRLISIGGGTDEMMLQIICNYMNLGGSRKSNQGPAAG